MENKRKLIVRALACALLMTGCASTQMVTVRPADTNLRTYSKVVLTTTSREGVNAESEALNLEAQVASKIGALSVFPEVVTGDAVASDDGTLLIQIEITQMRRVSKTARFFGGALAGKASLDAEVRFVDATTRRELGTYTVSGKSGGTGMSGGTEAAISRAADAVANIVSEHCR